MIGLYCSTTVDQKVLECLLNKQSKHKGRKRYYCYITKMFYSTKGILNRSKMTAAYEACHSSKINFDKLRRKCYRSSYVFQILVQINMQLVGLLLYARLATHLLKELEFHIKVKIARIQVVCSLGGKLFPIFPCNGIQPRESVIMGIILYV